MQMRMAMQKSMMECSMAKVETMMTDPIAIIIGVPMVVSPTTKPAMTQTMIAEIGIPVVIPMMTVMYKIDMVVNPTTKIQPTMT
jgi:hypothetical protein